MEKAVSVKDFVWRTFLPADPEAHGHLEHHLPDEQDWDSPQYDWEYFGKGEKYGRYAVCKNTNIKRGLTMGEFYGAGTVD